MDENELKAFLFDSNAQGYAKGEVRTWTKEADGSLTIAYERGPWRMHDNFFGGEPYAGREVVFHEGKPAWILVYYGWVAESEDADATYAVLKRALAQMPPDHPFRGPAAYREGGLTYTNVWEGDIGRVHGRETISGDGRLLYQADYVGGWVDRRKGV